MTGMVIATTPDEATKMTQWILVLQLATSFQTMGPFSDKTTCIDLQAQVLQHFKKVQTACVSVSVPAAPAAKQ